MKIDIKQIDIDPLGDWGSDDVPGSIDELGYAFGVCNSGLNELFDMEGATKARVYFTKKPRGKHSYRFTLTNDSDLGEVLNLYDGKYRVARHTLYTVAYNVIRLAIEDGYHYVSIDLLD